MARHHYAVYMLPGEPNTFIYTAAECRNTLALLEKLGFKYQHTLYAYGWSCTGGHMYSVPKYFNLEDEDRMIKLVRINNGTEEKIKVIYKEIVDAKVNPSKRWWQHYGTKK